MSDDAPPPKRKLKRRWLYTAAGATLIVAAGGIAVGPAAPWVVEHLADGARIWRLGHLKIEGVSGGWLGALHAEHITIEDESGVWLEANDVALDWRPQNILAGGVRLDRAHASSVVVHRQPALLPSRPSGGVNFDIRLSEIGIDLITVDEAVVGVPATFVAELGLHIEDDTLEALDLELRRTDSDADRVIAYYDRTEDYALNVDAFSAPEAVIARLLGVGEQGIRATARGEGDVNTGTSTFDVDIGEVELLAGSTAWRNGAWSANADARLDILPVTAGIARRIGPSLSARVESDAQRRLTAHAETPFLTLDLAGVLTEDGALDGPARFTAATERLSDIARESPFELGPARLEGELRRARGTTAIRGTLDAQSVEALGRTVRLSGPVEASLTNARFALQGDLRAPADAPPLFAQARLQTTLSYDRERRRFALDQAELRGDALALDAQGWVTGDAGEFAGDWRVRRLGAIADDLAGEAGGAWRAFRSESEASADRVWTITVAGNGAGVGGSPDVVPQLLGATPNLDARFLYENGGVTVSHARVTGDQLRAAATGRIVSGEANLALEASARGPLSLGGAEIAGAVDATGRITGRIARPTIAARAALSSFSAGGVVVSNPVVDFTLAPTGGAYAGRASVEGSASGQPLSGTSNVSVAGGALGLSNLDAQWGGLAAQGSASFGARGVTAALDVNGAIDGLVPGASGRLAGDLALTPETMTLDAQIMDARAGELRVRAATLRAQGPFNALAATFDLRGRLRQAPLAFTGTANLDLDGASNARIEGRGTLADADIFTRAPIQVSWREGRTEASLDVAVGDGVVRADWTERGRALNGTATIEDAPITPLAAIWGERATGRIDGRISLANSGGGLSGDADLTLNDARFAGRQRGTLDMRIVGDLDPSRLAATIDATSTDGLVAHFEANAPVVTSAAPIRIALAPERRGAARWSVRGPAESLFAAARLPDQSLQGQLEGEGDLAFGAGYLSGEGYIEIVDGRFEDKLTGVTLVDLDARIGIDDRGVNIENFTASGPRGGRLTATGGSANQREGRVAVTIDDMRIADRPDAQAVASGELTLSWEGLHSELTGDLNIIEANVDIAASPEAGIPTLDVIEINRPGDIDEDYEDQEEAEQARPRNGSTELSVRVRAPGRVFTRGRGIEAEWALDMRLEGTLANPQVFGVARSVRGTLTLSGQPFEIDEARIDFTGDPLDARVNLIAARSTADLTAYLRLTGTARAPEISFTSDPPLPEDEILPQVLFGRSVEDLSGLEAAQLASSLAALSGRGTFDIVDSVRAAAGLDRFAVRQDEDGGFLVAGGVYLTSDVYVEVARTGLGQAQTRVEYTIRPRLVLITSFLGNGDQRVSLRWRRETD